ncbi:LOW QUALITY PROTEIN: LIM homeobox transcription factor 1-alpha-like [Metopolophium dirhodum]|uniref:LOW QUALITY PROTEIN: LIM homeobox transcription factor 1-alpha-like n=1 Tax=Metopolophium dirhodum TaxID=44670 RepID=UPI0029903908|nr:LOW QUALITY PROTEIN: LIM homeobox transcription factor 1-alpha-like [Metopolophium dirhodum]
MKLGDPLDWIGLEIRLDVSAGIFKNGDRGDGSANCEGCGMRIVDRFLLRVGTSNWHEQCVKCSECGVPLAKSCYNRHKRLYCKNDYDRLFRVKCGRCGDREPLGARDLVMHAGPNHVYHVGCFVCVACMKPLQKGQQYVVKAGGGQPFCLFCSKKEIFLKQQTVVNPQPDSLTLDENCRPPDGRRRLKRHRTIFTSVQEQQLKASFEFCSKPGKKVHRALAKETGLSVHVLQVWFKNQRQKMKKI